MRIYTLQQVKYFSKGLTICVYDAFNLDDIH